jgi:UDP-N-acetylmuramate dehydrogenase
VTRLASPEAFKQAIEAVLGPGRLATGVRLSTFTTFGVGGPADFFVQLQRADEIAAVVALARRDDVPVTCLGGGSNALVSDAGVRGLVIRVHGGEVTAVGQSSARADAGVALNSLVRWTIGRGLAGLEAWAGTPGTVGGAVYGNAHYAGRCIGDLVESATLLTRAGEVIEVGAAALDFRYDYSRLHVSGEYLLSAVFALQQDGDPAQLREVARASLAHRKRTQPLAMPSAGCVFQNPEPGRDRVPEGIPWSAGALIDRAGLKGRRIGGARVSPTHANFIVNEGGATAADIEALLALCREEVRRQFGVELRDEIVRLE